MTDQLLGALAAGSASAADIARLSDLTRPATAKLARAWPGLPEAARVGVLRRIGELAEDRIELNFGRVLRIALDDESAVVRQLAVAALWEDDHSDLVHRFLVMATSDSSEDVRAEAARGLGRFAEQAASDDLDEDTGNRLRSTLTALASDPSSIGVRRRALESVAVFGCDPALRGLILAAYRSDDQALQASALYAMGKSLDPGWLDTLVGELRSPDAELRYEAARATGALGDDRAVPDLAERAFDADAEVRFAAISALGQIGGRAAVRVLRALAQQATESDGLDAELIDEALDEALAASDPLQVAF